MMSSWLSKRESFSGVFNFGNSQNSQGAMSG
jgi:hypothetical protein